MNDVGSGEIKSAGWLMAGAAALSILLMANHPSGSDLDTMATPIVHGGLQLLLLLQVGAMVAIWQKMNGRLLGTVALVLFIAGQSGGVLAATINGFVVPQLWGYPQGEIGNDIGPLLWELNQAFALLGAIAAGVAIAMFGAALWRMGHRAIGATGSVVGAATAAALAGGVISMDLHGALITYLSQLAWLAAFGAVMARKA